MYIDVNDEMRDLVPCAVVAPAWRRVPWHISERRVCTPRKRRRHVISKPLQWQWTGGVCSVSTSDESHFHIYRVSNGLYGHRTTLSL